MTAETIHAKVAGVNFKNPDGRSRQQHIRKYCGTATPVILRRDPGNARDKNTVEVWVSAPGLLFQQSEVQIGLLDPQLAASIADHIDHGGTVTAEITEITGGRRADGLVGVNIVLRKR
jgi:hypothetical protein